MRNKISAQELIGIMENAGLETRSYSGRGMYGKQCVAVTGSSVWEVARALPEGIESVPEPHTDALGHGIIIYWPTIEWPKENNE